MHKKRGERCVLCTASWQHVARSSARERARPPAL